MIIIVGLGNPGKKFEQTRHNLGFRVVGELLNSEQITINKEQKKLKSEIFEAKFNSTEIVLAKPQAFMNNSGKAVKSLINFYRTTRPGLVVIHDDIDLPLGKIKIVKNRGSAGHKGIESIIKELGTKNFVRFRVGIQPKTGKPPKQSLRDATGQAKNVEAFVLQKFNKGEEKIVKETIKKTVEAIEMAIKKGLEKTMAEFNQ